MNLLYVCWLDAATTDIPLFTAQAWERRGHKVHLFPYDLCFANEAGGSVEDSIALSDRVLQQRVLAARINEACIRLCPDAVLFGATFVAPEFMRNLRRRHGVRIGFVLGYNNLLQRDVSESVSVADFVLVHDSYVIPLIQGTSNGRCPRVFGFGGAAEPREHTSLALSAWDRQRYGSDFVFLGGYSRHRAEMLDGLREKGLRIWGDSQGWARAWALTSCCSSEPVYGRKKTKIYNAAKIVVHIEDPEKNINSLSARVPEVLACGGFVLAQWTRDLEAAGFQDGVSVAWYTTPGELADKAGYYLAREDQRRQVSEAGKAHVLRSLTYDVAYGPILDAVEQSLAPRSPGGAGPC